MAHVKALKFVSDLTKYLLVNGSGTVEDPHKIVADVNLQDQTTPIIIVPANQTDNQTTLALGGTMGDTEIEVASATGFVDGKFIVIADVGTNRFMTCRQIGAIAGTTVTIDTPLDFDYPIATTQVTNGTTNMGVTGTLAAPEIFSLRAADPGLAIVVDITRIIINCTTAGAVDMSTFGDIAAGLTNGLVLRKTDGTHNNIFNVKTNGELANIMYDFQVYAATNPQQGQDGFVCRMTFGGQSKVGVVIRVAVDEDLEVMIQDDLSSITELTAIFEGHVVDED